MILKPSLFSANYELSLTTINNRMILKHKYRQKVSGTWSYYHKQSHDSKTVTDD